MSKYWIKIGVVVIVFLGIAISIAGMLVSANTFRPALESQVSQALGRQFTLGNLSFSFFTGSLVAKNVEIAEDPAFGTAPFLQAKSLRIGVKLEPLIFDRKLIVTSFKAAEPSIRLLRSAAGTWNFASIGHGGSSPNSSSAQQESAFPDLTVGEIKITGGTATVSTGAGNPMVYSNLALAAQRFSMVKNFPFQISAGLSGGGTLSLDGTAGPIDQQDASATPVNAKLDLSHFDPVAAGLVDPSQGLSMLAVVSAQIASDGKMLAANGTVDASRLKLSANGSPAPNPVQIRFSLHDNLVARTGTVDSLNLGTGAVGVNVTGSYSIAGPGASPMTLDLQVAAPKVPVDQIEALLPAAGVRLPSGSSLSGGVFTANLKVTGPANALTIVGPVEVDGTRLAGFDLGSKIEGLKPVSGSQGGTEIQTVRADVTSSPAGETIQNLYASVPALGTATGSGTVSPAGNLNFHILAKLNSGAGVAGQALSGMSAASGTLGSLVSVVAAKGIPVDITGTTSNPQIRADMSGLLKQNATGLLKSTNPGTLLNKFLPH